MTATVGDLHNRAMRLCDEMVAARRRCDYDRVTRFARKAYRFEMLALRRAQRYGASVRTTMILQESAESIARTLAKPYR